MRQNLIDLCVRFLLEHDVEEKKLIDEARKNNTLILPEECWLHNEIEFELLNLMVQMTNEEITAAIDIYDNSGKDPYWEKGE